MLGKGIVLNLVVFYWFKLFDKVGFVGNYIVDIFYLYVWIVCKVSMVKVEVIVC